MTKHNATVLFGAQVPMLLQSSTAFARTVPSIVRESHWNIGWTSCGLSMQVDDGVPPAQLHDVSSAPPQQGRGNP